MICYGKKNAIAKKMPLKPHVPKHIGRFIIVFVPILCPKMQQNFVRFSSYHFRHSY